MPFVVHPDRLAQLLAALNGASVLAIQGDIAGGVIGNQRNTALVAHLLNLTEPVADIAVLVTPTAVTVTARAGAGAFGASAGTAVPVHVTDTAGFIAAVESHATSLAVAKSENAAAVQKGAWAADLIAALQAVIASASDMNPVVAPVFAVADSTTAMSLQKAGALVGSAFKRFGIEYVQKQLSSREPVSQADAANAFTEVLNQPDTIPGLESMDPAGFSSALPANVQCGPDFDFRMLNPAQSAAELSGPVVCISLAAKFNGVVAHAARTFFVQPVAPEVATAYAFLLEVHDKVRSLLTIGKALKDVHSEALAFAQMRNATLAAQLTGDFGFTTGMHFMDKAGTIGPRGTMSVAAGTMIVVRLTLKDVTIAAAAETKPEVKEEDAVNDAPKASEPTKVALIVADTVLCTTEGGTSDKALATKSKRGIDDVSFTVKKRKPKTEEDAEFKYEPRVTRGATATVGLGLEEAREEKQRQLFAQKRADWEAAGKPQGIEASGGNTSRPEDQTANGRLARGALFAYTDGIPAEYASKPNDIHVDRANHVIILPIGGQQVPFHCSTIQKIDARPDTAGHTALTITFGTTQQSNIALARHRNRQWVREVTYRRQDGGPLYAAMAGVKDVQSTLKTLDQQKKSESGLADRVQLKQRANAPRLPSVKMRPVPTGGRGLAAKGGALTGNLDAHDNGLRFSAAGLTVDIPYENMQHFICQPSRKDVVVLLHCALKAPMKIGDKPFQQLQFYTEVIETSEAATNLRRTHEEEIAAEERDQQRVVETNRQFLQFAAKVKEIAKIDVETPFKEVDFEGSGGKRLTRFRGNENALWSVSELPFTVISVQDIEVVSLERVLPGQATFDANFIHKDYKTNTMISTIPMPKLELLKDWMNNAGLIYFEGANNVMWTKLLRVMREDKEWEAWGPEGWIQYIDPNHDAEEGAEDDDSDADDSDYDSEEDAEDSDDDEEESDSEWASEGSSSEVENDSDSDYSIAGSDDDDDDEFSESEDSRKRGRGKGGAAQRRPPQPAPRRR
eukprot:CAMPEP_0174882330 /NCGR_PEP_ID=MMETSP1114-20130205/84708_1 /TAXON_ID=312471 /ORGANISM="Neobodo designis, Strain CCAP 1951/1" /LENGTH=1020 /DNA_ID=CAMNT_0016117727 /DNA_START=34 /DNA_END=3096 /DNA_ORIENTATION=+